VTSLSPQSQSLIAAARGRSGMTADDKTRIRGKLAQRIGGAIAAGSALATSAGAAQATHLSVLSAVAAFTPATVKWVMLFALSGAVGAAAVQVALPRHRAKASVQASNAAIPPKRERLATQPFEPVAMAPASIAPTEHPTAPSPTASPSAAAPAAKTGHLPQKSGASAATNDATGTAETTHSGDDTLARQVSAIRESRAAIRRGDAKTALAALDEFSGEHQGGPLEQEALLARVSALCLAGDTARARLVAARFKARFPDSLQVPRLTHTCAADAARTQ